MYPMKPSLSIITTKKKKYILSKFFNKLFFPQKKLRIIDISAHKLISCRKDELLDLSKKAL